jgi:hypothetical protein
MIYSLSADEIQGRFTALDDMPLLSQWIKKSKSEDLDFLAVTNHLDAK